MFDFLKKRGEVPDVGQEEEFDEKHKEKEENEIDIPSGNSIEPVRLKKHKINGSEASQVEFGRIGAKLEALDSFSRALNERLSSISQQIGELRAMNLNTEKSVSKATQEALKTIDIVREVKPENLKADYQKIDLKVGVLSEKLDSNKQFLDTVMNEVKDIRRKAGIFIGTDALLRLNEDVKKDLIEMQRVGSRVRTNAEKSEQLFIGLKKEFAETQKNNQVLMNLDNAYSELTDQMGKLKIDLSKIVKDDDFYKYKQTMDKRMLNMENSISKIDSIKQENERLSRVIESTLSIAKRNKENIGELAVAVGDNNIEKVSEYEERFSLILKLIHQIASELKSIKGEPKPALLKKLPKSYKPAIKKTENKSKDKTNKHFKKILKNVSLKNSPKIEDIQNELKSILNKPK